MKAYPTNKCTILSIRFHNYISSCQNNTFLEKFFARLQDEFWLNGCMFWRFQRIFSFFVKRNRTERRKNANSRSIFDKYLDYLANEDRKKILIKSALSLNKFNHPAYADGVKTSRRNSCQKWFWEKFIWTRVTVRLVLFMR